MWRRYKSNQLVFINQLLKTVNEIPPEMLEAFGKTFLAPFSLGACDTGALQTGTLGSHATNSHKRVDSWSAG
jgi:hypothetical protein